MPEILGVHFESFETVPELISYASRRYHTKTAIKYFSDTGNVATKTYVELLHDVMKLAGYLQSIGAESQHVCLIGECSYEWVVSFYAISWAGAVPVLIDCELSDADTYRLISEADGKYVLLDRYQERTALAEKLNMNHITAIGVRDETEACVQALLTSREHQPLERALWSPEDTALIVFTSGTTGDSKAVMLTHKNLCSDLFISYYLAGQDEQYSTVAVLPVHHMFQLTAGIQCPLYIGVPLCIGRGKRYVAQSIKTFKPSLLVLVPAVVEMLRKKIWADARLQGHDSRLQRAMRISDSALKLGIDLRRRIFAEIHTALGGNLRTVISGGAPIDNAVIKEFKSWGVEILNGYGITECSPVVCCNTARHQREGSVGMPKMAPYSDVGIIDGEICVRGDIVMKGYYHDDVATSEVFDGDWFKTGDLGYLDDGYLFITGRKKNLIILSNGENVSSEELELYYSQIVGVKDILVYAKPVGFESILSSVVVPTDEIAQQSNVQEYFIEQFRSLSKSLPPYKRVYEVTVRNSDFARSSNGKIKRTKENYPPC